MAGPGSDSTECGVARGTEGGGEPAQLQTLRLVLRFLPSHLAITLSAIEAEKTQTESTEECGRKDGRME